MPKKFMITDKNAWLDLFEKGKSEKYIAGTHAHCDFRTVKKGIEEARRVRDAREAKTELLKDALRKHHEALLGVLEEVRGGIQAPPPDLQVPCREEEGSAVVQLPLATSQFSLKRGRTVSFKVEDSLLWELLEEHLRRVKMWKMLRQWKNAAAEHIHARVMLKQKAAELLEEKTGLKLLDHRLDKGPYLLSYEAISRVYQAALPVAIDTGGRKISDSDIVAYPEDDEVAYLRSNIPIARSAPGETEQCRGQILEAIAGLKASGEFKEVATTYTQVVEHVGKAGLAVEETVLLGLVPGQCRVCRQLGI